MSVLGLELEPSTPDNQATTVACLNSSERVLRLTICF